MKKVSWILFIIGFMVLGWYLFVRSFEFEVNFKAKTLPGDIIQSIRLWNRSLDHAEIIQVDSINHLEQKILFNGRTYIYDWYFKSINDSTTKVHIEIAEPYNSLSNKLLVPFTHQAIEQDAAHLSNIFYEILKEHLAITDVTIDAEIELPSTFCLCKTIETRQIDKAKGMMTEYGLLTSLIDDFDITTIGPPQVRVLNWSHSLGTLRYNFCFPIVKKEPLPDVEGVFYDEFKEVNVLKATYHGNYITSDRAWYSLLSHAAMRGYEVAGLPIEYFHNNPNTGINEKEWKAEVFLPVNKEKSYQKVKSRKIN